MLNHDYWKELEIELSKVCRVIIHQVFQSEYNKKVYMFVLDVNENYGSVLVAVNTEDLISKHIKQTYPNEKASNIRGVRGIKYNPGECDKSYFYAGEFSEKFENLIRQYETTIENLDFETDEHEINELKLKFLDSMVIVLNMTKSDFKKLKTTKDFIFFVTASDVEENEAVQLIKKTVNPNLFNKVFPEVLAYESHLKHIYNSLNHKEQAKYWVSCYIDFSLNNNTNAVVKLKEMLRWETDLEEQITILGHEAIDDLIHEVDRFSRKRYFDEGAKINSHLASSFLMMINTIEALEEFQVHKLSNLLHDIFYKNEELKINDTVIPWLASVIHSAKPDQFPRPIIGAHDNKLENFAEFGL